MQEEKGNASRSETRGAVHSPATFGNSLPETSFSLVLHLFKMLLMSAICLGRRWPSLGDVDRASFPDAAKASGH